MKIEQYLILAGAGILVTAYKIMSKKIEEIVPQEIAKKTILSLVISILIVPALLEYFKLSFTIGIAIVAIINLFVEVIMKKLENKIGDKIDEL
jgi:hypothetical protein